MSSHQQQVLLLRKCLNYRIQDNIFWYNYHDFIMMCISEEQIFFILYEAHDLKDHWAKKKTLTRLRKYVYWSEQSANVKCYIEKYIHYVCHDSVTWSQLLQSVIVMRFFQLFDMNYIESLSDTVWENWYIFHVMNYFARYS